MPRTKYMWHRYNEEARKIGERVISFAEFKTINPVKPQGRPAIDPLNLKKYKKGFFKFYPPTEKKQIKRPPAVYSNQSIYDKYGV